MSKRSEAQPLVRLPDPPADRSPLLAAVIADPDDDVPRLIYADWLQQQGDSQSVVLSEFIRIGCHLARLHNDSEAWLPLKGRELNLVGRHRFLKTAGLPEIQGVTWSEPVRGFVEGLTAGTWSNFPGEAVFRTTPLRSIRFVRLTEGTFARLVAAPWLGHIETLDLGGQRLGCLRALPLLESAKTQRLRQLNLQGNQLTNLFVQQLAGWPQLAQLQWLNLARNRISVSGWSAFVQSASLSDELVLRVERHDLCDQSETLLRQRLGHRLQMQAPGHLRNTQRGLRVPFKRLRRRRSFWR